MSTLRKWRSLLVLFSAVFSLLLLGAPFSQAAVVRSNVDNVLFLVPDSASLTDPRITVWLDAAKEEGLHLKTITDTQFKALGTSATQYLGLIMPDQVHINADDTLVAAIKSYVSGGGNLMLVYDAGTLTPTGFYPVPKSRFSDIVGVDYALYSQLLGNTIGLGNITALQSTWRALRVPPGKSMLYPTATVTPDPVQGVTSYFYGFLNYPSFVTQGTYTGTAFISSPNYGLVMGLNQYGSGRVLFVNTPLGYLKGYGTDGLLLHGVLHYFAVNQLKMPYFSSLPRGNAGMVLNIHTDCGNSLADIQTLYNKGFWNDGPYSIDFTAGPDCIAWGDNQGLNVPGNPTTQSWAKFFVSKGHEVGSHGGWIHDFYGLNVSETNQNTLISQSGNKYTFNDLLTINKSAIEAVTGKQTREYAAPEGNTPKWSVAWLEQNGFVGYYWVGNTGMAPTRGYREGQLFAKKIWAHPITPYGKAATFEEFVANGITKTEATTWLTGLVDFVMKQRTSRMIYFHEPGLTGSDTGVSYISSIGAMQAKADSYGTKFKWYTMTRLSDFMNTRDSANWNVSLLDDGSLQFAVTSTLSLNGMTWVLPKTMYAQPVPAGTNVTVVDDATANEWLVIGTGGKTVNFNVKQVTPVFK